ncbi:MAG TPA: flavodoxin [Burkholderiales bacterium]|nr:flavodoxin [Burkholderiales bacterium]
MKTLVIYFSRTGHTQKIAEAIAANYGSDIEKIKEVNDWSGVSRYLAAGRDAMFKRPGSIQSAHKEPVQYDLIILGTPIWAWNLSPPMRAYIAGHKSKLNQVAFFCTEGGSGGKRAFRQMADLIGKQPVATLEVTESDLRTGADQEKLNTFYHTIAHQTGH